MTWHGTCNDFDSRIEASAQDVNFNDVVFLLTQSDADNPAGDKVYANKAILALISPVFYAQFYGPFATKNEDPIEIVDGTAHGFKQLISFICNPKSFELHVQYVIEVFDISYFAHKYQIGSLVSLCRQSLGNYDVRDKEVDVLNWAVSSECGLDMKETFPAEHALLVHNCWEYIAVNIRDIFPNGEMKETQDLPDESLMMEILAFVGSRPLCESGPSEKVDEEFVLSVAMDYFYRLIDKGHKLAKKQKNDKTNEETEWDKKLDKIKSVVRLESVRPKNLAAIYEKFFNKVPDKVIGKITKEISSSWKDKDNFPSSHPTDSDSPFEIPFSLIDSENSDDWIHADTSDSGIQIKFKTNQNAILRLDLSKVLTCSCSEVECCVDDSITFQTEDYKEEITIKDMLMEDDRYFYVKENKETSLTFRQNCDRNLCESHLLKINDFHLIKGNFKVDILEVNGESVTNTSYTFIQNLIFTPI